jgi:hypothetical protein
MGCVLLGCGAGRPAAAVASYAPSHSVTIQVEQIRVQLDSGGFNGRGFRSGIDGNDHSGEAFVYYTMGGPRLSMTGSVAVGKLVS